ncbi:protein kinase [Streptomyces sp. NPDC046203]|uniref:serine/threonine-protein kinase n=1 Tax=Streptomyces sp. NPDC046203 TaxID=3154602 RepID=UPI0033F695B5
MRQGVLLDGRYELTGSLGHGGMGEVWAARDQRMQRDVAVKFAVRAARDETLVLRFRREVRAAAELPGRYTPVAHDWGAAEIDGVNVLYLVMERLPGPTLSEAVGTALPDQETAVSWARQVAAALDAAHRRGIVHRDVKPNNVMFTEQGELKVLDFGIAKFFGDTLRDGGLTLTGLPMGTPAYMSPEQAKGERTVDHRSDLYALGALLYFLLTGRAPVTGENAWAITYRVIQGDVRPVAELAPGTPRELAALVMRLLAREPEDRPASAAEVLTCLDGFAAPAVGLVQAGRQALSAVEREAAELRAAAAAAAEQYRLLAESAAQQVRNDVEAYVTERRAQAEDEAAAIRADARRHAQEMRDQATALYEETRTKAAQAAVDFETNLARRRDQSERDLATRHAAAEARLTEIERKAEQLSLETDKVRQSAERRAYAIVERAVEQRDERQAAMEGERARMREIRAEIAATLSDSRFQPVGNLAQQRARIVRQLEALADGLSAVPEPSTLPADG